MANCELTEERKLDNKNFKMFTARIGDTTKMFPHAPGHKTIFSRILFFFSSAVPRPHPQPFNDLRRFITGKGKRYLLRVLSIPGKEIISGVQKSTKNKLKLMFATPLKL